MVEEAAQTSSGVHELVQRLREEGVAAARADAERIVGDARQQAARLLADARQEAERMRRQASEEVAREREAGLAALQLAGRDASQSILQAMTATLQLYVQRLMTAELSDPAFLRELVLSVAGAAAADFARDRPPQVGLAAALFEGDDPEVRRRLGSLVLGLSREMLRDGVELVPDPSIKAGARLRIAGDHAELDLSDEALSALLLHYIVPRFRSILDGIE